MKIKNFKQKLLYLLAIGASIFFLFFFITCSWIGYEVKGQCQDATGEYGGNFNSRTDCVNALASLLNDEKKSFRDRNRAIWALGQLGDNRALPTLESYYTGNIPEREPLDQTISQYELKKAVNLAGGATNLSAFVWRGVFREK